MTPTLLDTGCIVAFLDRTEHYHEHCARIVTNLTGPLITCEAVIMESCYLLRRVPGASDAILDDVRKGTYQMPFKLSARAADVAYLMRKYADVPMDLADACLVDLATQTGSGRILTLDTDFRIYRWGRNRAFDLLIEL